MILSGGDQLYQALLWSLPPAYQDHQALTYRSFSIAFSREVELSILRQLRKIFPIVRKAEGRLLPPCVLWIGTRNLLPALPCPGVLHGISVSVLGVFGPCFLLLPSQSTTILLEHDQTLQKNFYGWKPETQRNNITFLKYLPGKWQIWDIIKLMWLDSYSWSCIIKKKLNKKAFCLKNVGISFETRLWFTKDLKDYQCKLKTSAKIFLCLPFPKMISTTIWPV